MTFLSVGKETINEVNKKAKIELRKIGFKSISIGIFVFPNSENVNGSVGLNTATAQGDGIMHINPVIGIRHHEVERLYMELDNIPYDPYIPITFSSPLGYVMPERNYKEWNFSKETNNEMELNSMINSIKEYGIPFIKKNSNLPNLLNILKNNMSPYSVYRVPIIYFLMGNLDEAKNFLYEQAKKNDLLKDDLGYKLFSQKLQQKIIGV